jgi:hypothetical protein
MRPTRAAAAGGVIVTVNELSAGLFAASLVEHKTCVSPITKLLPDAGAQDTVSNVVTTSAADAT